LFLLPLISFKSSTPLTIRLKGYFIVLAFRLHHDCPCGLDISSTKLITGEYGQAYCLCDGNYYKNFGITWYVPQDKLDENRIDDFKYFSKNAPNEHYMFLSVDKRILSDNYKGDTLIARNDSLIKMVQSDTVMAENISREVSRANLNFAHRGSYYVLMKGEVTALRLNNMPGKKTKGGIGKEQYLFLNDPSNTIEFVKVIKDRFGS